MIPTIPSEPSLDDREYDGTAELMDSKPLPKEVRVFEAHRSTDPEEMQEEGDIIEIQGLENDKRKGKVRWLQLKALFNISKEPELHDPI